MSTSILMNGLTSPIRNAARTSRPRSILRRPAAMPLSPSVFQANFSIISSPGAKSPHVQFMATPKLVSMFATHSSDNYDRAPIRVSPNPVELPKRGDRLYSPTLADFKLLDPPKPKAAAQKRLDSILRATQQCASPAITEFADPRSPREPPAATQHIRFANFAAPPPRTPRKDLSSSIHSYPRSPYPSATTGSFEAKQAEAQGKIQRPRSFSETKTPKRALGKGPSAPIKTPRLPSSFMPVASPLQQSFGPPPTAGLQRSHKPAPLALEPKDDATALSDAFWEAVSLDVETPMVTALEYPSSAVEDMEMEEVDLRSPAPIAAGAQSPAPMPMLMFGNSSGEVWSPSVKSLKSAAVGTPRKESLLRSALMSPGKVAFTRAKRSDFAAPSPNDPFAAFPSFAAALSMAQSDPAILFPAPVAQMA